MRKIEPLKQAIIEGQQDRISRELPELIEQLKLTADEYLGGYGILLDEYLELSGYLPYDHVNEIGDAASLISDAKAAIGDLVEYLKESVVFDTMPRQLTDEEKAEIIQRSRGTLTITDSIGTSFTISAETLKELLKQ